MKIKMNLFSANIPADAPIPPEVFLEDMNLSSYESSLAEGVESTTTESGIGKF